MDRMSGEEMPAINAVVTPERIMDARKVVNEVYVDDKIKEYIIDVIFATRKPDEYGIENLSRFIEYGASPRASIALNQAAKAHAFLKHRGYVTPEDIKSIGPDILRHRIAVTYEAEAEEINSEDIVRKIFDAIEVP
jgi:MoxR-like ATPase